MSGEILTILGVGIALGGLLYTSMARLETRLGGRISALEGRIHGLEAQIGELRERMARLEGLLEGLREAITGRAAAG